MDFVTPKNLLEAGVHFGHRTDKWNPKMEKYIFAKRSEIHVIDLEITLELLKKACEKAREVIKQGGTILFVGTKKQCVDIVKGEAERCNAFYVSERWLGGTLTNFVTIRASVQRMKSLEQQKEKGDYGDLTKKEILSRQRELTKLKRDLAGIENMESLPNIIYITDIKKDRIAVREAKRLSIPIIAIIDTNVDPDPIDYPIPGNDDAIKSVQIITSSVSNAIIEGTDEKELLLKQAEKQEENT